MNKLEFQKLCENKIIYLDGATGSNLFKAGMTNDGCPETWILEHEDAMIELQKSYVAAGSQIVYAPTFTSNRIKLAEYGLENKLVEINTKLVNLSKRATDGKAYVAGDITMTGKQLKPIGDLEFEQLIDVYKEQIRVLEQAGVDLLIVETMMSLQETRAAVIAAKEISNLPIMATLTFETDGRTLFGTDAKSAAIVLDSLQVDAIGANCSTGPAKMCEIIREMASVTKKPLIAKPNAGLPYLNEDGQTVYDMNQETFAKEMLEIVDSGATILGGCCGTSPEYIKALYEITQNVNLPKRILNKTHFLSSERQSLEFALDDNFMVVGERINPTGKKILQEQLRQNSFELVREFAEQQEEMGAKLLDVNMGMSGIDEKIKMLQALEEIAQVSSLPLSIDSSRVDVVEAALRNYPGRALINSISLEKEKFDNLLPIAKKYGAMFVLLPLSDQGLPKLEKEKRQIIHTIVDKALELGLNKEDIIVDGLVTTVASNHQAAVETLETIKYCKENGLATICGLSNISFGLPERINVNVAFLTMAIQAGLTMAIANPNQKMLMNAAITSDLLMGKKDADLNYIKCMAPQDEKEIEVLGPNDLVRNAVLKGQQSKIVELTINALEQGTKPQELLNHFLMPAINEVGELFDCGKYFLPQLIASAETMKKSIEYMEPLLAEMDVNAHMPTVVIATVKGDIHDIGKNLVALMLKNYGFHVIDLGKDVDKEEIIRVAKAENAKIIALSALMTTTMKEMKNVIDLAKIEGLDAKIMIGGAVITSDYAEEIGADGYSKDAADAVKLAKKLC